MPFRFICAQCGVVLLETKELKPIYWREAKKHSISGIENFIIKTIGEQCPSCGNKLRIPPEKVDVHAILPKYTRGNDYGQS